MRGFAGAVVMMIGLGPAADQAVAQSASTRDELRQVMDDFVRGWREGDADLLSEVLALDQGRITWVSGQGGDERVESMTFREAVDRNRAHPEYGRDGWQMEQLDIVNDELAFARLRIPEGESVNIDYMVCFRVAGRWRIVSNTFVVLDSSSTDIADIVAASRSFSAAYVRGDTAAIRMLYTSDAVVLPPGREIRGQEAIARYFAPSSRRTNVSHTMEYSELRIQGDIAIDVGTWENAWRVDDGPEQTSSDRYLIVWRRGQDGSWRIEYDMWHQPSG